MVRPSAVRRACPPLSSSLLLSPLSRCCCCLSWCPAPRRFIKIREDVSAMPLCDVSAMPLRDAAPLVTRSGLCPRLVTLLRPS